MRLLGRLMHAPALHFLLLGGMLLAGRTWWEARAPVGRDDDILHHAALALGVDRADPAVRTRLVRLGGFVGEEGEHEEAVLEREARRLGLERSDLVVRRHLVQMMRLATRRLGPGDLPTETELAAYLDRHAAGFTAPARIRLTHVYLSRERRGAAADAEASALLAELRQSAEPPEAAAGRGDAFVHGTTVGPASRADLQRFFGDAFARAVADAPAGTWLGPVASAYGLHLVWVHERLPETAPTLAAVRGQVLHRWLAERGAARSAERLAALRVRFGGIIEDAP